MSGPTVHEVLQGLSAAGAILNDDELAATAILAGLDAAGYAIVRKPTDEAVEAARRAYVDALLAQKPDRNTVTAMAAALAAAEAVSDRGE